MRDARVRYEYAPILRPSFEVVTSPGLFHSVHLSTFTSITFHSCSLRCLHADCLHAAHAPSAASTHAIVMLPVARPRAVATPPDAVAVVCDAARCVGRCVRKCGLGGRRVQIDCARAWRELRVEGEHVLGRGRGAAAPLVEANTLVRDRGVVSRTHAAACAVVLHRVRRGRCVG